MSDLDKRSKKVTEVESDADQVKITVKQLPNRPGIAGQLFTYLADKNINVDLIVQNIRYNDTNDITFTIQKDELLNNSQFLHSLPAKMGGQNAEIDTTIVKLTVKGEKMDSTPGIAAHMFRALGEEDINIRVITTYKDEICCLIDERDEKKAVNIIKNTFDLKN